MPRPPRCMILSETNHIMLRGIGHMDLFYKDSDYRKFLKILKNYYKKDNIKILAYCLMNNHVHLIIQAHPENIPVFLKRVEVSYASYFNKAYEHVGHLFQNRYLSEPITDERYLLNALRYILLNPQNAGICKWNSYQWSSSNAYLGCLDDGITDTSSCLELLGKRDALLEFICKSNDNPDFKLTEPVNNNKELAENKAIDTIRKITGFETPTDIQKLEQSNRNRLLLQLKRAGMSVRQIERITGINRNVIQRIK